MDDIRVPTKGGTLNDLDMELSSQDTDSPAVDNRSSQEAKLLYAKEAKIQINYTGLDSDLAEVWNYLSLQFTGELNYETFHTNIKVLVCTHYTLRCIAIIMIH